MTRNAMFETPDKGVSVSPPGHMYAGCSAYGCNGYEGVIVRAGSLEVRFCERHARQLRKLLRLAYPKEARGG